MTPRAMPPKSPDVSSDVSSKRNYWRDFLWLAAFFVTIAGSIYPAAAQRYTGSNSNSTPSVTVDYSVLDELGRAPNIPQLILQNPTGSAYRNNPYRGQPRFPVVSKTNRRVQTNRRVRTKRLVLTPPSATKRRTSPIPARKIVRRSTPTTRNMAVQREPIRPIRKPPPVTRIPRAVAPPPPSIGKAPATIAPPPPKIAAARPRSVAPSADTTKPIPPKAVEPPPLPPVSTAPKPKQIVRSAVLPPPAPPGVAPLPPAAPRKIVTSRSSASRAPKKKPARVARANPNQVASLPKSTASVRSGSLRRIEFPPGSAKLSNKASLGLQNVAAALTKDTALRIQLLAYAGQSKDSASQARRLSLSRALAARSKLIEKGVRSTRIDVRALGNKSAGGPADRIDIIVTKR